MLEGKLSIEPDALMELMRGAAKPRRLGRKLSLVELLDTEIQHGEAALEELEASTTASIKGVEKIIAYALFASEAAADAENNDAYAFFDERRQESERAKERIEAKRLKLRLEATEMIEGYRAVRAAVMATPDTTALGEVILAGLSPFMNDDTLHAKLPPLGGVENTDGESPVIDQQRP